MLSYSQGHTDFVGLAIHAVSGATNVRTANALAELEQKLHGKSKKWSSRSRLTLHDPVSDPEQDFSNFNAQDACSQVPIGNMTQLAATGLRDESAN